MGYIKEPKGVDFIIQSEPLTDSDRALISAYIRRYKAGKSAVVKTKKAPRSITNKQQPV
jgi:phage terminase small subunit